MKNIKRHPNGMGSVLLIENDLESYALFVADAKYRSCGSFSLHGLATNDIASTPIVKPDPRQRDTKTLSRVFQLSRVIEDGAQITNLMSLGYNCEAADFCRKLFFDFVGRADIPTVYQMGVIYANSYWLNQYDPTINESPFKFFGCIPRQSIGSSSPWSCFKCWASDKFFDEKGWLVSANGFFEDYRYQLDEPLMTLASYGVIPVKRLELNFNYFK